MTNNVPVLRKLGTWDKIFTKPLPERLQLAIIRWVEKQRWYLEKAIRFSTLGFDDATLIQVQTQQVWWLLFKYSVNVFSTKQECIYYQLPLLFDQLASEPPPNCIARLEGRQTGYVLDAWQDKHFVNWFATSQSLPFIEQQCFINSPLTEISQFPIKLNEQGQSNTSYLLGNRYFLKIIRRLLPGIQPEVEMASELTRRGSSNTVPLISRWEWKLPDSHASLALLSAAVDHLGNGWDWLQKCPSAELLPAINQLGEATAMLHQQLAQPSDNPAFAPECIDHNQLLTRWKQRLITTLTLFQSTKLNETANHSTKFVQLAEQLLSSDWNIPISSTADAHRIHGDYHLGQVLRTNNNWYIIDFEGEPLRPLEERRAKDLPWRDVAGMLRSFGYLHHTLNEQGITFPLLEVRQTFLNGYSTRLDPATLANMQSWLPHYELEKALYEIEYEIRSRPKLLEIPLRAAVQLLQQLVCNDASETQRTD